MSLRDEVGRAIMLGLDDETVMRGPEMRRIVDLVLQAVYADPDIAAAFRGWKPQDDGMTIYTGGTSVPLSYEKLQTFIEQTRKPEPNP